MCFKPHLICNWDTQLRFNVVHRLTIANLVQHSYTTAFQLTCKLVFVTFDFQNSSIDVFTLSTHLVSELG